MSTHGWLWLISGLIDVILNHLSTLYNNVSVEIKVIVGNLTTRNYIWFHPNKHRAHNHVRYLQERSSIATTGSTNKLSKETSTCRLSVQDAVLTSLTWFRFESLSQSFRFLKNKDQLHIVAS